ncbi:cytochrome P450 [Pseudonocardia sp. Cha107L01]|uniref:cytochrome P450 n=1 Tax=Pseudonocardia sp. Cha107L01 TaxID=3457576 RepID=UPI00403ED1F3
MTVDTEFIPATSEAKPEHSPIDVSSKAFWAQTSEQRDERFARLRAEDPVSWQRPVEDAVAPDPNDPGYWAVTRHADIVKVSRDAKSFISGQGVLFDLLPPEFLEMSQSFLAMDAPRHDHLRKLVSSAFTPKRIQRIDEQIKVAAREVVDSFAADPSGEIEFVERCAEPLPVRLFCDMFGVPEEVRAQTAKSAGDVVSWADPERLGDRSPAEVTLEACQILHGIAGELTAERRKNPADDLFTSLVQAEVDGERLTDHDIGAFFTLLSVAGTDTTKHTSAFTVKAMTEFPDQRDWLRADFDGRIKTALEEFVRFASPVMTFRRTAVVETELAGRKIIPGDKVVLFYPSGNRDEDVFDEPERFDLSRDPNPHVGFGGGGLHFCLGNQLAKGALRALFSELLTRVPDFQAGEPDLLGTNFMRGVKRLPFTFTPEK